MINIRKELASFLSPIEPANNSFQCPQEEFMNTIGTCSESAINMVLPHGFELNPAISTSGSRSTISRVFDCPLCSVKQSTQAGLNDHMRKEHSILI